MTPSPCSTSSSRRWGAGRSTCGWTTAPSCGARAAGLGRFTGTATAYIDPDGHCTLIADGPQTGVQSHRWSMMVAGGPENTRAYVEYEAATRRHRALWPTDTLTDD
jgi:hypothetical protein